MGAVPEGQSSTTGNVSMPSRLAVQGRRVGCGLGQGAWRFWPGGPLDQFVEPRAATYPGCGGVSV